MSFQVVTLTLRDGRHLDRAVVVDGQVDLSGCADFLASPFSPNDVTGIEVTHDRSGPPRFREGESAI